MGVARTSAPAPATTVVKQPGTTKPTTIAAQLASSAPVDSQHVEKIKQAVASGNFPISPSTIADRLIAARYEWMANDQA